MIENSVQSAHLSCYNPSDSSSLKSSIMGNRFVVKEAVTVIKVIISINCG